MLAKSRISFFQRSLTALTNDFYSAQKILKTAHTHGKCRVVYYSQDTLEATRKNVEEILPINKYTYRTHTCGEVTIDNVGESVHLCGWMEFQRMGKFITLRDSYGTVQLIIPNHKNSLIKTVKNLHYESVMYVTGKVVARPPGEENLSMPSGSIEIEVENLEILNGAMPGLPLSIRKYNVPNEALQMEYRYLALRFPTMQKNLRIRSQLIHKLRTYLIDQCGFVDVETPTLFRKTPGGAQEFIVPTKHPGKFYSLVQSPQLFKQLLMIGGIDRYFQIARCYRNESGRPDRQPEFTQLDIEMSFTNSEAIMNLVESLLQHSWPEELGRITIPIQRMKYKDAMETYGTDKPDLRIPYRMVNVSDCYLKKVNPENPISAYALTIPNASQFLTNPVKSLFNNIVETNFNRVKLLQMKFDMECCNKKFTEVGLNSSMMHHKLKFKEKDVVFVAYGEKNHARQMIGKIQKEFVRKMEENGLKIRESGYKFLWITDFPLFVKSESGNGLNSSHHPFTAVHPDDIKYLESNPLRVRGVHYDLVLNGSEIAGGSMRIHDAKLQEKILELLNIDHSQMTYLLKALASGAPPHGGIAFGLDRLLSIICDTPNIKSVIAFPKTMEGRDLMSGAPAAISEEEKLIYHLSNNKS